MIGVLTQQSDPGRKGTSSASFAQVRHGIGGVRRRQSRVVRWAGPSDGIGRSDRAAASAQGEGPHHDASDQIRVGERGTETGHTDRRNVRRRGLHRRRRRDPLRRHEDALQRRVCTLDGRGTVAGVHPDTPASWSQCCANTWSHCAPASTCCPAPISRYSSTSTRCYARSTGAIRAPPTGTKIAGSRSCARDCPRWRPRSAPRAPHR